MDLEARARRHHALSDVHRLTVVDELSLSDRTPSELLAVTGLSSNLLAFHLDVLEAAGLISRHASQGDGRRRYVTLEADPFAGIETPSRLALPDGPVLFVCSGNSARSQLAAAAWVQRTGRPAVSAGATPARQVHPKAIAVARRHGLDLSDARPRGYDEVDVVPSLLVSVCDRAREGGWPFEVPALHWSVPKPTSGGVTEFERAWAQISRRVDRLAEATAA